MLSESSKSHKEQLTKLKLLSLSYYFLLRIVGLFGFNISTKHKYSLKTHRSIYKERKAFHLLKTDRASLKVKMSNLKADIGYAMPHLLGS